MTDPAPRRPAKRKDAATVVEYGLIAALVAVVIIAAVNAMAPGAAPPDSADAPPPEANGPNGE